MIINIYPSNGSSPHIWIDFIPKEVELIIFTNSSYLCEVVFLKVFLTTT